MKKIALDIGANQGEFSVQFALANPDWQIIAIEPVPELVQKIRLRASSAGITNLAVEQFAIDSVEGEVDFNLSSHADWGVSSLHNFAPDNLSSSEYWGTREDLYFDKKIRVTTSRLSSLLSKVTEPENVLLYLKIDTQGNDLVVLNSLDQYLNRVCGGVLEAPTTENQRLYEHEPTLQEALNVLHEKGFTPSSIKPNDSACAEVNIFFENKKLAGEIPDLQNVPILSGKNYWHFPSDSPFIELEGTLAASAHHEVLLARQKIPEINAAWSTNASLSAKVRQLKAEKNELALALVDSEFEFGYLSKLNTSDLENYARALEEQVYQIKQSRSWKVTGPLRFIGNMLRKMKRKN